MQISDWINVALCILSFLLAAISVVTVVITLRQNHKMIENATRPYIAISYETTCPVPNEPKRYIVVKNYGQSAAEIKDISCTGLENELLLRQFNKLKNSCLAPMQRRIYYIPDSINSRKNGPVTFSYTYCGNGKKYTESAIIQLNSGSLIPRSDKESYLLQEIVERLF